MRVRARQEKVATVVFERLRRFGRGWKVGHGAWGASVEYMEDRGNQGGCGGPGSASPRGGMGQSRRE